MLRELIEQMPDDHSPLRLLALLLIGSKRYEEAVPWLDRAASLPGGDAKALSIKANALYRLGRYAEAAVAADQSLDLTPSGETYVLKVGFSRRRGDLRRTQEGLAKVPPAMLLEERNAYSAIPCAATRGSRHCSTTRRTTRRCSGRTGSRQPLGQFGTFPKAPIEQRVIR